MFCTFTIVSVLLFLLGRTGAFDENIDLKFHLSMEEYKSDSSESVNNIIYELSSGKDDVDISDEEIEHYSKHIDESSAEGINTINIVLNIDPDDSESHKEESVEFVNPNYENVTGKRSSKKKSPTDLETPLETSDGENTLTSNPDSIIIDISNGFTQSSTIDCPFVDQCTVTTCTNDECQITQLQNDKVTAERHYDENLTSNYSPKAKFPNAFSQSSTMLCAELNQCFFSTCTNGKCYLAQLSNGKSVFDEKYEEKLMNSYDLSKEEKSTKYVQSNNMYCSDLNHCTATSCNNGVCITTVNGVPVDDTNPAPQSQPAYNAHPAVQQPQPAYNGPTASQYYQGPTAGQYYQGPTAGQYYNPSQGYVG